MDVRYPDCEVQLTGTDGNAFAILGLMRRELGSYLRAFPGLIPDDVEGDDEERVQRELEAFTAEATSGDYDHLLQTCMRWVSVA